jgi:hypothetical protein
LPQLVSMQRKDYPLVEPLPLSAAAEANWRLLHPDTALGSVALSLVLPTATPTAPEPGPLMPTSDADVAVSARPVGERNAVMRSKAEAVAYSQERYPWLSNLILGDGLWKIAIDILFRK